MVERVARAAYESYQEQLNVGLPGKAAAQRFTAWDKLPPWTRTLYIEAQRAGIAAMREITGEPLAQGAALMAAADMTRTETGERREMDEWFEDEGELTEAFRLGWKSAIDEMLRES